MTEELFVNSIRMESSCQPRHRLDPEVVGEYAEAMKAGASFPPVTVYTDGSTKWLADGFHRVHAAREAGAMTISAVVREGTIRDAILHAVGANADHGLRRTNADKRRAVETLLNDPEWSGWSDSEIARRCAVHHTFVGRQRSLVLSTSEESSERTYTDRYGNTRTMDISNIGSKPNLAVIDMDSGEVVDDEYIVPSEVIDGVPAPTSAKSHSTMMAPAPVSSRKFIEDLVDELPPETQAALANGMRESMTVPVYRTSLQTVAERVSAARYELSTIQDRDRLRRVIQEDDIARESVNKSIAAANALVASLRDVLGTTTPSLRRVS